MIYSNQYGQTPLGGISGTTSTTTPDKTQDGKARIQKENILKTQLGKAKILIPGVGAQAISGRARIIATLTATQNGLAAILLQQSKTRLGKSRIKVTIPKTQTGKASISGLVNKLQLGLARILKTQEQTITGVASIIPRTILQTQDGKARVDKPTYQTQSGRAYIRVTAWDERDKPTTSFTGRTKPTSIWTERTNNSTDWT